MRCTRVSYLRRVVEKNSRKVFRFTWNSPKHLRYQAFQHLADQIFDGKWGQKSPPTTGVSTGIVILFYAPSCKNPTLWMQRRLLSKDGWTYSFNVVLMSAWPSISLTLLISAPFSMHRVANVCRRAWKPRWRMPQRFRSTANWYWQVRGSIGRSTRPVII